MAHIIVLVMFVCWLEAYVL